LQGWRKGGEEENEKELNLEPSGSRFKSYTSTFFYRDFITNGMAQRQRRDWQDSFPIIAQLLANRAGF
jgi:hypothetical protein